jgi:uncharacterized protein (DUF433 family)
MDNAKYQYIGAGVYTIAEASRLTGVSSGRIRRWMKGYEYGSPDDKRTSPPVFAGQFPRLEGFVALSFLDLIEVRFVDAFLRHGVTWRVLRVTHARAQEITGTDHPFCSRQFRTDGQSVFIEVGQNLRESAVLDLFQNQLGFTRIISPYLKGLEFQDQVVTRWWPLGRSQPIVIDGARSFGQPIIFKEGVPTAVLNRAYLAEDSIERVASWFEVEKRSVRAAVKYEFQLAA